MKRFCITLYLFASFLVCANAQIKVDMSSYRDSLLNNFHSFRGEVLSNYEKFRNKINEDYIAFINSAWKGYDAVPMHETPEDSILPVPPIYFEDSTPVVVNPPINVVPDRIPEIVPQPNPTVPIDIFPKKEKYRQVVVSLYGTDFCVLYPLNMKAVCSSTHNSDIAKCWEAISNSGIEASLSDLLEIRKVNRLCDLLYLQLLNEFSISVCKSDYNTRIVLLSYLFAHSGYKTRIAKSADKLYLLYGSEYSIYDCSYFVIGNEKFYPLNCDKNSLEICDAFIPGEQPLSLRISTEPKLSIDLSEKRMLVSSQNIKLESCVNEHLIHFYNTYPSSYIDDNPLTRWAIIANTPLSSATKDVIYPTLSSALVGKDALDKVNILLNFVQTAFEYEYDDKVWGYDRAFFAEEVLMYPYCDCEDRTILFTRLVRDLVGLECAIVCYPGHLAAAVLFNEDIIGDAIIIDNKKYIICDPTYINSSVGMSMPGLDVSNIRVMQLSN